MAKATKTLIIVMAISLAIAFFWNSLPLLKDLVNLALNPLAGKLLDYNVNLGIVVLAGAIGLFITLIQKYTTDQETLRAIKKEQKLLQQEMKQYKDHPEKLLELQKKQFEFIPKTFDITMRPLMYTSIPIILFFRWFSDYFTATEARVFGMNWLLAYFILSIIFSIVFRKIFKVA